MTTDPILGQAARNKILRGIGAVHSVIAPTLGPAGRSVLLPRTYARGQRVVDDGYYASENVLLKDPHERLAAEFFKECIKKSNTQNGDGTTGCGVFGYNAILSGYAQLPSESETTDLADKLAQKVMGTTKGKKQKTVREVKDEMKKNKDLIIAEIKKNAKPIKTLAELEKIASVSIGKEDSDIAKIVAKLVWEICRDASGNFVSGHIDVVEGYKGEIETELVTGMKFPAKVAANAFINKLERHEMVAEDTQVLITNYKLDSVETISEIIGRLKLRKVAIFSPEFSDSVLLFLVELVKKNGFLLYPIKCPALRTAQMEDLAIYTQGFVIDKDSGKRLENTVFEDLGFAEKIIVKAVENREDAVLLGGRGATVKRGKGNLIDERIAILTGQLAESRNDMERVSLQKRIANLHSAGGTIRVGSATEGENIFIKMKIEDGVYACRGALEMGYVKGGGLCLKEIAETLPRNILTEALCAPYEQIQKNAGGIDIGKEIIDPAKVVIGIVENGTSVASALITAHAVIPEIPEETVESKASHAIAKAIRTIAYFNAKEKSLLQENEDEMEKDRNKAFEKILFEDDEK